MLLVKIDLKFGKGIKNKGRDKFGGTGAFFRKIFEKLEISIFFEKKLCLQKEDLEVIQNQVLILPSSTNKKT